MLPLPPLPGAAGSATSTNGGGGANASYFKDFFRIGRNHLGWKVRIMHVMFGGCARLSAIDNTVTHHCRTTL